MNVSGILQHQIIGLDVEAHYLGRRLVGTVLGETRNMLAISVDGSAKWVPKKESRFIFTLPNGSKVLVDGVELVGRPHEKIRRGVQRWRRPVI